MWFEGRGVGNSSKAETEEATLRSALRLNLLQCLVSESRNSDSWVWHNQKLIREEEVEPMPASCTPL